MQQSHIFISSHLPVVQYFVFFCHQLFTRVCRYTVHDVVTMLENDDNFKSAEIYISPPADSDSDEDSGSEDSGGIADNLPSNMLLAVAHMTIHRGDGSDEVGDEDDDAFIAEDGSTGDTVDVLDVDSGRPTD